MSRNRVKTFFPGPRFQMKDKKRERERRRRTGKVNRKERETKETEEVSKRIGGGRKWDRDMERVI